MREIASWSRSNRPLAAFLLHGVAIAVGLVLWTTWLTRCATIVIAHAELLPRRNTWLYDWNVYHAAASDLLERSLYRGPLVEPGHPLPVEVFNYPPLAAAWAVPLLPFGREPGGIAWLVIGILATSAGALLATRAVGLSWRWASVVAGLALAIYATLWPHIENDILLANNNHLVFALAAGFAMAHVQGHQRVAGVVLALAIGTKLWPVALVVLLLRERRWLELRWAATALAVQGVLALAWLGPDVIGPMVPAILGQNLSRGGTGTVPVLWTTWARQAWDWWPAWGTYAVAGALLLVPATGRLGLGLGIIGGLSLNLYLWHHYAPVFAFGVVLILVGALARLRRPRWRDLSGRRGEIATREDPQRVSDRDDDHDQ